MAYNHPIGSIYRLYTGYILLSRGLYIPYHLLPEPAKTIEYVVKQQTAKVYLNSGQIVLVNLVNDRMQDAKQVEKYCNLPNITTGTVVVQPLSK